MEEFIFSAVLSLVFPGIPILLFYFLVNIIRKRKEAEDKLNKGDGTKQISKTKRSFSPFILAIVLMVTGGFIALVVLRGNHNLTDLFFKSWLTILEVIFVLLFFEFCKRIFFRKSK